MKYPPKKNNRKERREGKTKQNLSESQRNAITRFNEQEQATVKRKRLAALKN